MDVLSEDDRLKLHKAQAAVGGFLDELTSEQSQFNYSHAPVADALSASVTDEMKAFSRLLVEKKMNQPRDLHNLPASGLALTLGSHPTLGKRS